MLSLRLKSLKAYNTETSKAKIKLSSNELPYELPDYLKTRIAQEISKIPLNRYPDPLCAELKEVLADFFGIKESNILLGNGSDELIYYISTAVGELNEAVLIPVPTFPMYEIISRTLGRPRIEVLLKEDFDLDLEKILEVFKERKPILAYFSFPNNPTGNLFSKEKIERIRSEGLFAVLDEAYYHYSGNTFLKDALEREDTVVLRTLSKIGLAGLRIGILIGKEEIIKELDKIRLPFNITYPSQVAAVLILREGREFIEQSIKKVVSERQRVYFELQNIKGVEVFPSKANFILFRTPYPASFVHEELLKRGVLIRNMSYLPGLERCLRVSIGKEEENDAFLEALSEVIK